MYSSPDEVVGALYVLMFEPPGENRPSAIEFCLEMGVLGVGWGVGAVPLDWQSYQERAIAFDGAIHGAVVAIHDLPDGSLIWTRDPVDGDYYIAQVTGPWQYLCAPAALSAGIQNVRSVRIVACTPASQVPSTIVDRFIGEWTIQRIHDAPTACRSALLFAQLIGDLGQQQLALDEILTSQLTDEQIRNVVSRYLHWRYGYVLRPAALRRVFGSWEYVVRGAHGGKAIIRAGRGFSVVPQSAGSIPVNAANRIFVFSPTATYGPTPAANVTAIEYHEMVEFIRAEPSSLPPAFECWLTDGTGEISPARERSRAAPFRRAELTK